MTPEIWMAEAVRVLKARGATVKKKRAMILRGSDLVELVVEFRGAVGTLGVDHETSGGWDLEESVDEQVGLLLRTLDEASNTELAARAGDNVVTEGLAGSGKKRAEEDHDGD